MKTYIKAIMFTAIVVLSSTYIQAQSWIAGNSIQNGINKLHKMR